MSKLQFVLWMVALTPLGLKFYDEATGSAGYKASEIVSWPWWVVGLIAVGAVVLVLAIDDVKRKLPPPLPRSH